MQISLNLRALYQSQITGALLITSRLLEKLEKQMKTLEHILIITVDQA